jgi:L-threonylcarbamoyladenylate synthase
MVCGGSAISGFNARANRIPAFELKKAIALVPIFAPTPENLEKAAALLRAGRLVAFPTETVYGLGGDARDDRAVAAIYAAKGRPRFNPLILHVAEIAFAARFVRIGPLAEKIMRAFWPGPLTLVLPRVPEGGVSLLASAGLETLAVRFPAHPVAQDLIRRSGLPIVAPSANASGRLSPTEAAHVAESLGDGVEMILDDGRTQVGVESTVLDLTEGAPTILRPGGVTKEKLVALLGPVRESQSDPEAPKSPGQLSSHYAPKAPLRMNAREAGPDEAFLTFGPEEALTGGALRLNLSPSGDTAEAAANLFAFLRRADLATPACIAVAPIPDEALGHAINDRLRRAAGTR